MVISNVDAVYDVHVGNHARFVSHDVVDFNFSVCSRASPCPSPPCFLLKLCVHDLEILLCCPFYKSVSYVISLAQAEASCRPIIIIIIAIITIIIIIIIKNKFICNATELDSHIQYIQAYEIQGNKMRRYVIRNVMSNRAEKDAVRWCHLTHQVFAGRIGL